jgi:hypothetical protein
MRWWVYILLCTLLSCTTTKESKDEALTPLYTPKYAKSFSIALDSLNRKDEEQKNEEEKGSEE